MIIGFAKIPIDDAMLNIEIVDRIPDGYDFLKDFEQYKVYEKKEAYKEDTNHYFIATICNM